MQIKIDPEKDSIEKLNIVAKIIEDLKRDKEPLKEQKPVEIKKDKKKQIKLTAEESFLFKKYKYYLTKTLMSLTNREIPESPFGDTVLKEKNKIFDELHISKIELFKEFTNILKKDNIGEPNPFIFEKAVNYFQKKGNINSSYFQVQFYFKKTKYFYKVIF